jgi:hypothetical protein
MIEVRIADELRLDRMVSEWRSGFTVRASERRRPHTGG